MKKYIEVIERQFENVVMRADLSHNSDNAINKIEDGMNLIIDHTEYFTKQVRSESKLDIIDLT